MQLRSSNSSTDKKRKASEAPRRTSLRLSGKIGFFTGSLGDVRDIPKKMVHVCILDDVPSYITKVADEFSKNVDEQFINYYHGFEGTSAVDTITKLFDTCEGDFFVITDYDMIPFARNHIKDVNVKWPDSDPRDPWYINNIHNGGHAMCMINRAFKLKKAERPQLGNLHFIRHSNSDEKLIETSISNCAEILGVARPAFSFKFKKDGRCMVREAMVEMGYLAYLTAEKKEISRKCHDFHEQVSGDYKRHHTNSRDARLALARLRVKLNNLSIHEPESISPVKQA